MQSHSSYSSSQRILIEQNHNGTLTQAMTTSTQTSRANVTGSLQTTSTMYTQNDTMVVVQQIQQNVISQTKLECHANAKKLWAMRMRKVEENLPSADPVILQSLLKENIDTYLNAAARYHTTSTYALTFATDLQEKSLHEFKSKYFAEQTGLKADYPFPFTKDLDAFFTGNNCLNGFSNKKFMKNEAANFNAKLNQQMEMGALNRNEMLRILLNQKTEKRALNGKQPLDAYVVDVTELSCFMDKLLQCLPNEKQRMQLMVRTFAHYTAVDIELSPEGHRCLVLDAALDKNYMNIPEILKNYPFEDIYVSGKEFYEPGKEVKIQYDFMNCSAYALSQLSSSSKMENLFDSLEQMNYAYNNAKGVKFIEWNQFPAVFLKLSQTISLLQKHPEWEVNFKNGLTLQDYIMTQAVPRNGKMANKLVEKKFQKYADNTGLEREKIGTVASLSIGSMNCLEKLAAKQAEWSAR